MKLKITLLLTFFLTINLLQAQSKSKFDAWPEIVAFHKVMSQTFHPSEEGNFGPIKERSGEMLEKAKQLASSKIPAEFDTKAIKKSIKNLVKQTTKINKLVKSNASDETLNASLIKAHEYFHEIMGLCSDEHEH